MANKKCLSLVVVIALLIIGAVIDSVYAKNELIHDTRCEPITSWMCESIGYNFTTFPNAMNHQTQEDAHLDMVSFSILLDTHCSTHVRFLLCTQYIPMCIENYRKPLKACRSVCERSRDECKPIWRQFDSDWPDELACDQFPDETDEICLKPDNFEKRFCDCSCKSPLITLTANEGKNIAKIGQIDNCTLPCHGVFFTKEERIIADRWIKFWSGLCFICAFIALITFTSQTQSSAYPEKSMAFLMFCSLMVATGFVCSKFLDPNQITCDGTAIKFSSIDLSPCTIVFCIIYFFGMASSIWWIILSFTWFATVTLHCTNESIERYTRFFHGVAWLLPTIQTAAVLWFGAIDADSVARICYVGNLNMNNLKVFVVIPSIIYFMIGSLFLLAGFTSLFNIRTVIHKQQRDSLLAHAVRARKPTTTKRSIHIGIFGAAYIVPASIVIACQLYEITFHDEWMTKFTCPCNESELKPRFSVFLLKYTMFLAFGTISNIWIFITNSLPFETQFTHHNQNRGAHTLLNENDI